MPTIHVVVAFSPSPSPGKTQAPTGHVVGVVSVTSGVSRRVSPGSSCAVCGGPCLPWMGGPVADGMASCVVGRVHCRVTNSMTGSVVGRVHRQRLDPQNGRQGTRTAQTGQVLRGVSSFSAQRPSARGLSHLTQRPQELSQNRDLTASRGGLGVHGREGPTWVHAALTAWLASDI